MLCFLLFDVPFTLHYRSTNSFCDARSADSKIAIEPSRTSVWIQRKKQLQSALVSIPVLINGFKAGVVDSGREKFFDVSVGANTIIAGDGKPLSEKKEIIVKAEQQPKMELEIGKIGLGVLYILSGCK